MAMSTGKVVALIQAMGGGADPAAIEAAVQDWLDAHPEATTTVQDGSITEQKLATAVAQKLGLISQLSDEIDQNTAQISQTKNALQTTLIECMKNVLWAVSDGKDKLLSFCRSIGLYGWIDIKYNTSLDSNGAVTAGNETRETSDYIDINDFTGIVSELQNSDTIIWYTLRCYDESRTYIGLANPSGTAAGSIARTLPANTRYIRLLLTNNTSSGLPQDLKGVYTGHVLKITLTKDNISETRFYYLSEVGDFDNV